MKKLILIFGLLLTMSVFSQQLGDTRTKAVLNESFEKNYQGSRGKTSPFYYAKDGWLIVDVNIVEPVPVTPVIFTLLPTDNP